MAHDADIRRPYRPLILPIERSDNEPGPCRVIVQGGRPGPDATPAEARAAIRRAMARMPADGGNGGFVADRLSNLPNEQRRGRVRRGARRKS